MKPKLYNDHFQNYKTYGIPKAQLIIADIPYNIGNNAYGSNPSWYIDGDNKNGESHLAGKGAKEVIDYLGTTTGDFQMDIAETNDELRIKVESLVKMIRK